MKCDECNCDLKNKISYKITNYDDEIVLCLNCAFCNSDDNTKEKMKKIENIGK